MFAYCNNNPVVFSDSSGMRCVIAGTHLNEGARKQYYETADEAAKAFSEEVYRASMYTLHEYGTEIYSIEIGGTIMYSYAPPRRGRPHYVRVGYATPIGTEYVAFAHIQPNNNKFSDGDFDNANRHNVNAYVVGPSKKLQKYESAIGKETDICTISPVALTASQYTKLYNDTWLSWEYHLLIGCDYRFGCYNKSWPPLFGGVR